MPIYKIYYSNGNVEEIFLVSRDSLNRYIKNKTVLKVENLNKPTVSKSKRTEYRD